MNVVHRLREVPLERLHRTMAEIRAFELALADLWQRGLVSGELHLGIGEEAAVAGVVDHLREGDSMALDHRSTPPLVARGTPLRDLVLEMLGADEGLCRGQGGHMHLFDPDRRAASSGIVGSSGPTACGFALAHQQARAGDVSVAFFGEGAANQGMLLEAWNLAVVWRLPVVFVCKDSRWAITSRSTHLTGGDLGRRARGFGLPVRRTDGTDVGAVWTTAGRAVARARSGRGPTLLLVRVKRPRGHFEGDPLVRMAGSPAELVHESGTLLAGMGQPGSGLVSDRVRGLAGVSGTLLAMLGHRFGPGHDPVAAAARRLDPVVAAEARAAAVGTVGSAVAGALDTIGVRP